MNCDTIDQEWEAARKASRAIPTPKRLIAEKSHKLYCQVIESIQKNRTPGKLVIDIPVTGQDVVEAVLVRFRAKGWIVEHKFNDSVPRFNRLELRPPFNGFDQLF